jgi:phosphonate transport system permease protein
VTPPNTPSISTNEPGGTGARASDSGNTTRAHDPRELWSRRPRSRLVRMTIIALALLVAYSWLSGDIAFDDLFTERRLSNVRRFLTTDIQPFELRDHPFSIREHAAWGWKLFTERGLAGAEATLAISVLAITLAGAAASMLMLFAARNLATSSPFVPAHFGARRKFAWRAVTGLVRGFLIFLRAIPEYIWAYLLLAMLGASAWPAVLALAIHNSGILGKLGAETVENLDARSLRALRILGGSRAQIAVSAIFPLSLSRCLLYFFYRFETCVREATVLGMLGVVSLGYWIQDARSRQFYDQMVFFVALGAAIVLAADLVSALVRARIRRAS